MNVDKYVAQSNIKCKQVFVVRRAYIMHRLFERMMIDGRIHRSIGTGTVNIHDPWNR